MSITYNEMKQQYEALKNTFSYMSGKKRELLDFFKEKEIESITYIGCGSSYCLCQSAELTAKARIARMYTSSIAAGDLMLNHKDYGNLLHNTMIVALSRSGSTSEVLKAIEVSRDYSSVPVLAITCIEDSPLEKLADFKLKLPWAYDESVCQTRTIVNLYAAHLLLAAYLSGDIGLENEISMVIEAGESYMAEYEPLLEQIAEADWTKVVVLADGEMKGIAAEGALAMTEIAKIPGSFYHLLDVRHGPMVLVNKDTLVIACLNENGFEYQKSLIKDIAARGAKIVVYSSMPIEPIDGVCLHVTSNFAMENAVGGLPFIFIPQAIACYRAQKDGINPDNPEGLTAWVKV